MDIIYIMVKVLTIPGASLKAVIEHLVYRLFQIPIEDSRHCQKNELFGHIEHELTHGKNSFILCFLPSLISSVLGLLLLIEPCVNIFYLGNMNLLSFVFLYFALSFLTNVFPLREDVLAMWESLYGEESEASSVSKFFLAIPAVLLRVGAVLERYGLTLLTSIAFSMGLPYLLAMIIG